VERAVLRCPHWDGHDVADFDSAMAAMRSADLLVVSGQGTITDTGGAHATLILDTIDFVKQRGTPVAMLGQGLGPLADGALRSLCAQVLPGLTLLAMRERRTGPAIAAALGVSPDRLAVSGDDAVELAYEARSDLAGRAIGVNVRIANNAGIARDVVPVLRPVLHAAARRHDAKLVALPIARHKHSNDPASIREVTESFDEPSDGGQSLTSPLQVIRQAGRCRLVVSCAYHAAVFALAQGVPAVCLSGSRYYDDKFLGLRDMFGEGCEVIPLREGGLSERLEQVIDRFWADSDRMRPALRAAAARQVALGWATYLKLRARIQPPAGTDHGGRAA
jgi:colanic acid/amylovoran biosynthesis protein